MKKIILPLCAILSLSACSSLEAMNPLAHETGPYACPEAGFMADAGSAPFFVASADGKNTKQTPDTVNVYAVLDHLEGECTAGTEAQTVDFSMNILAQKTPLGQGITQQDLSYFIAVIDQDENVLQRDRFYVTVDFGKAESGLQTVEHRVKVPAAVAKGARVAVGFTLTPEQVAFNKAYPHDIETVKP